MKRAALLFAIPLLFAGTSLAGRPVSSTTQSSSAEDRRYGPDGEDADRPARALVEPADEVPIRLAVL
jgi:hypothetical protein